MGCQVACWVATPGGMRLRFWAERPTRRVLLPHRMRLASKLPDAQPASGRPLPACSLHAAAGAPGGGVSGQGAHLHSQESASGGGGADRAGGARDTGGPGVREVRMCKRVCT